MKIKFEIAKSVPKNFFSGHKREILSNFKKTMQTLHVI